MAPFWLCTSFLTLLSFGSESGGYTVPQVCGMEVKSLRRDLGQVLGTYLTWPDAGSHLPHLQDCFWCSDATTSHCTGNRDSVTELLYFLESLAPYSSSHHHFRCSSHSGFNLNIILLPVSRQWAAFCCCCIWSKKIPWILLSINAFVPGVWTLFRLFRLCLNYNFWHTAHKLWMLRNERKKEREKGKAVTIGYSSQKLWGEIWEWAMVSFIFMFPESYPESTPCPPLFLTTDVTGASSVSLLGNWNDVHSLIFLWFQLQEFLGMWTWALQMSIA